jgi:hypothetical protein
MAPRREGFILVFDLDQTLIDTHKVFSGESDENKNFRYRTMILNNPSLSYHFLDEYVNHRLITEILKPAAKLRGNGVDGIFLLTNNNSDDYVKAVCRYLANKVGNTDGNTFFFDYVMTRNDPAKERDPLGKNLSFIKHMLKHECPFSKRKREPIAYTDDADLTERLFFFDDQIYDLFEEFPDGLSNHYIQIKGSVKGAKGFHKNTGGPEDDRTRYGLNLQAREAVGFQGGSRKRRRAQYKGRLTKHIRRRKN